MQVTLEYMDNVVVGLFNHNNRVKASYQDTNEIMRLKRRVLGCNENSKETLPHEEGKRLSLHGRLPPLARLELGKPRSTASRLSK